MLGKRLSGSFSFVCFTSLLLWGFLPPTASAIEIEAMDGELSGSLDTTVTFGLSVRTSDRDSRIIGLQNGGQANSVNGDNGNLNYNRGDITSAVAKVTSELDLSYKNFGVFARALYFYDTAIMNSETARTDLSPSAERYLGQDFVPLDYYLTGDFELGGMFLTVKGGSQVVSWGESTFIQNGINRINPIDVSKLRVAGAELKEGLQPLPMIDVNLSINERFSVEGFYQFYWDHTEIEPEGTFFSTNDFASPGGDAVLLGFGEPPIPDNPPIFGLNAPVGVVVPRGEDRDADDMGQFGLAFRYFEPNLNETEFGFYWTRLHSRLPLISARTGTLVGVGSGDYAASAEYFREFPEDIDSLGASFNTEIGSTGFALQGEVSYTIDQPLQVDDVELLFAALTPLNPAFSMNQLGTFGFNEEIKGYREKDVIQAQMTGSQVFGPGIIGDQLVILGEVGFTYINDMEDKNELRYEGAGTYTSANPFFTGAGIQPSTESSNAFPDELSWGYRLLARTTFNNAVGAASLTPQIAFSHDVEGTTPAPITNFVANRKAVTASITLAYLNSFKTGLSYTNFFGGARYNLLNDRDFVSLTASYSF